MPKFVSDVKHEEVIPQVAPKAVASLAFRVKACGDNLFAAEMIMVSDNMVVKSREGVATTLGHAIGAADDLMDGWACAEIEKKPEAYFNEVFL